MTKVILDSSFILTCVRQKIDFIEELRLLGLKPIIPNQVLKEIKRVSETKSKSLKLRDCASLSLKIINKNQFEKLNVEGKYVDSAIKNFLKDKPDILLAAIDKNLKKSVPNGKVVIRDKTRLEII